MTKKKPKVSSKPNNPIVTTPIISNSQLVISYDYLDLNNKKYNMQALGDNKTIIQFYKEYYKKMKEYCEYENFKKFISENGRYRDKNHIHQIDWKDSRIREDNFTSLSSNLMQQIKSDCWQLGINNNGFRVHGFFIENVFYIVWLDPLHNLYEKK